MQGAQQVHVAKSNSQAGYKSVLQPAAQKDGMMPLHTASCLGLSGDCLWLSGRGPMCRQVTCQHYFV